MLKRLIDLIMKVPSFSIDPMPVIDRVLKLKKLTVAIILGLAAIPMLTMVYGFVHMVGTQKIYCLNCHVNQRNVDFWKTSKVHPDISCADCHDTAGKTGADAVMHFEFSSKEDVVSRHCAACHKNDIDRPVGSDAKEAKRPPNELIRIPHAKHINELGIKCTYCHSNVFHERMPGKFATYRPTMEVCYSCHDEEKTPCTQCHPNGMPAGAPISGKVGGGKIVYAMAGGGDVTFNHKKHAVLGLTCNSCHSKVFAMKKSAGKMTMGAMSEGRFCGHCHNGKGAFKLDDCARCHRGGVKDGGTIGYAGGGAGKVSFSHSNHIGTGLTCKDCHTRPFAYKKTGGMKMAVMDKGGLCGVCHNGKKAFASTDCAKCHAGAEKGGGTIAYKGGGSGAVNFSHESHISMGMACKDCHTKLFGYKKTSGKMTMDKMGKGGYCGGCHNGKKAFSSEECANCHQMS